MAYLIKSPENTTELISGQLGCVSHRLHFPLHVEGTHQRCMHVPGELTPDRHMPAAEEGQGPFPPSWFFRSSTLGWRVHIAYNGHFPAFLNWTTFRSQWPERVLFGLQTVTVASTYQFFPLGTSIPSPESFPCLWIGRTKAHRPIQANCIKVNATRQILKPSHHNYPIPNPIHQMTP